MFLKKTWQNYCPVFYERLRLLNISHYNFFDKINVGQLVVLDIVAEAVLKIFKELYHIKFPIAKILPIEFYNGSDDQSMEDNNSSCFNCRGVANSKFLSIHSYGLAIDINPLQNPCITPASDSIPFTTIAPLKGDLYLDRTQDYIGMITPQIVEIFTRHGFDIWGGNWQTPVDYQHFQVSRTVAELLALMPYEHGCQLFNCYQQGSKILREMDPKDSRLTDLYRQNPENFIKNLQNII